MKRSHTIERVSRLTRSRSPECHVLETVQQGGIDLPSYDLLECLGEQSVVMEANVASHGHCLSKGTFSLLRCMVEDNENEQYDGNNF